MTSINSAISVDLSGQVEASSIGTRYYSGESGARALKYENIQRAQLAGFGGQVESLQPLKILICKQTKQKFVG